MKTALYIITCMVFTAFAEPIVHYFAADRVEAAPLSHAFPCVTASSGGGVQPKLLAPVTLVTDEVLDYIWSRESSQGRDGRAAGNEYQITSIWLEDCDILGIVRPALSDNQDCRRAIVEWLEIRSDGLGCVSKHELWLVYHLGRQGYRNSKGI